MTNTGTAEAMTTATDSPHNHFNCSRGCDPAKPLTLIDREVITGRQIAEQDDAGNWYCADCLAGLPAYANGNLDFAALWHVCGEELTAAEPEQAEEAPESEPQPEAPLKVARAKVGDIVCYHGDLTEFHGIWEVTVSHRGRLRLFDVDRALANVPPGDVTVVQTAATVRRLLKKAARKRVARQ